MSQLDLFAPASPVRTRNPLMLSTEQRAHLHSLRRGLGQPNVAVLGFDAERHPVVSRRDQNGEATYAIRFDGCGRDHVEPVTQLTDDEVEQYDEDSIRFLAPFPHRLAATAAKEATP